MNGKPQQTLMPTRKVGSGLAVGSAATVIIWVARTFFQVEIPPEVAAAMVTVAMFVISYLVPDKP